MAEVIVLVPGTLADMSNPFTVAAATPKTVVAYCEDGSGPPVQLTLQRRIGLGWHPVRTVALGPITLGGSKAEYLITSTGEYRVFRPPTPVATGVATFD